MSSAIDRLPSPPSLLLALVAVPLALSAGCGEPFEDDNTIPVPDMGADVGTSPDMDDTQIVLRPSFDPSGEGFYDMPWPTNYRTREDGTLDLETLPFSNGGLVGKYRQALEKIDGYSTMSTVFIRLDQRISPVALPLPDDTIAPDSTIQLVDVSEEGCGERVPLVLTFDSEGDRFSDENLLRLAPVPGFVLEAGREYAAIVTREFGDNVGARTARPEGFGPLLDEDEAHPDAKLEASYAPLRRCMVEAELAADDIAVATVFRTQTPTDLAFRLHDVVRDETLTDGPALTSWERVDERSEEGVYTTYRGTYDTPIYQRGETPYTSSGGGVEFDGEGVPIEQRREEVPFAVTIPEGATEPLFVKIWIGGTGTRLFSHVGRTLTDEALADGFAVMSFLPQFHGERAVQGSDEITSTFNYINPESGRTVFLQQLADTVYFVRVIRELLDGHPDLPALDLSRIVYGGQSQGAIVGSLVAAISSDFDAFVLNGVGGYLASTLVFRTDPIDIERTIKGFLQIQREIDRFHLISVLAQTGVDRVDIHNYAHLWKGHPGRPQGTNVLLINGKQDHTTAFVGMNSLTIAGDVAPIDEPGWDVDPYGVWDRGPEAVPIEGNRTATDGTPITLATYLNVAQGHFTLFRDGYAEKLAINFWASVLDGLPATVEP